MKIETIRIPVPPGPDNILGRAVYTDRAIVFDHNHKEKDGYQHNNADRDNREETAEDSAKHEPRSSTLDVVA